MKKISILVLSLLLALSIAACGRNNDKENVTPSNAQPSQTTPILPDMDPTLDTNIPDPNINTEIPSYTDGTDPTNVMPGTGDVQGQGQ